MLDYSAIPVCLGHFTIAFTDIQHQHAVRLFQGEVAKIPKFIVESGVFDGTSQILRRLCTINGIVKSPNAF